GNGGGDPRWVWGQRGGGGGGLEWAAVEGTRQLWLFNPQNFTTDQAAEFAALRDSGLKGARAWAAKELFSRLWNYRYEDSARKFLGDWYGWVSRSRLKPMIKAGKMLKRHLDNILTYLR